MGRQHGHSLLEMIVVIALSGLVVGVAAPSLSGIRERAHMRGAARELATLLRTSRSVAIAEGRNVAVVFEHTSGRWRYGLFGDGDGDGVRTGDVSGGTDVPLEPPGHLSDRWSGVELGFLDLTRVRRLPPSSAWFDSLGDPVQFGADMVSFSPLGDSTSGSLYLTNGKTLMTAIVLYGPTARLRIYALRHAHRTVDPLRDGTQMADGRDRLRAWTLMDELVIDVYAMTRKIPGEGPDDLPVALRGVALRAAVRIIQGVHGHADDFVLSIRAALGTLAEFRYYLYLSRRLGLIDLRRYRGACARHEKVQTCLKELLAARGRSAPTDRRGPGIDENADPHLGDVKGSSEARAHELEPESGGTAQGRIGPNRS